MKVEDIMTTKIEAVEADATVQEVMKLVAGKMIRSVLVKPKTKKDVFGVIAVRDLVHKVLGMGLNPKKIKADEIATKPLICVKRDMDTKYLMNMMQSYNVARVFVTDGKEIMGVVALMDFIKAAVRAKG
jgi:predicted transcriptional regulator